MPKIPMTGGTVPMMERLDFNRPVVDQIYSALKSAILSRELFPGQAVSENEIGQSFNSSRTPVREALSRLRDDGLIVTLPSRGTYVSRLSDKISAARSSFVRRWRLPLPAGSARPAFRPKRTRKSCMRWKASVWRWSLATKGLPYP